MCLLSIHECLSVCLSVFHGPHAESDPLVAGVLSPTETETGKYQRPFRANCSGPRGKCLRALHTHACDWIWHPADEPYERDVQIWDLDFVVLRNQKEKKLPTRQDFVYPIYLESNSAFSKALGSTPRLSYFMAVTLCLPTWKPSIHTRTRVCLPVCDLFRTDRLGHHKNKKLKAWRNEKGLWCRGFMPQSVVTH